MEVDHSICILKVGGPAYYAFVGANVGQAIAAEVALGGRVARLIVDVVGVGFD